MIAEYLGYPPAAPPGERPPPPAPPRPRAPARPAAPAPGRRPLPGDIPVRPNMLTPVPTRPIPVEPTVVVSSDVTTQPELDPTLALPRGAAVPPPAAAPPAPVVSGESTTSRVPPPPPEPSIARPDVPWAPSVASAGTPAFGARPPARDTVVDMPAYSDLEQTDPGQAAEQAAGDSVVAPVVPTAASGPGGPDARLILAIEPTSARADGFRATRDALIGQGAPRVLAITSAARGEGKSTLAVNLGLALAELHDTRVLLVDAHHQEPQLAAIFGLTRLVEALGEPTDPDAGPYDLLRVLDYVDLACPPIGAARPPAFDLRAFALAMEGFRAGPYAYILVDAPPALGAPMASRIAELCDGVVVAVRGGTSSRRALRRTVEQLGRHRVLGATILDG